ncbi:MAG TPA: hypothetical protein PKE21_14510 [Flavobacteriales bacterium]|nr:hypothetical protein [Flavobacteriales bacterium]HMR28692.1 hypothetical protein [Flavobacteriales bacterium]
MKFLLIPFTALLLNGCCAGGNCSKPADDQTSTQTVTGAHTCTTACANGSHVYAHGETGHVCDASCMPTEAMAADTSEVAHVCTAACMNGQHTYVHGETGHFCDPTCKHAKTKRM